MANEWMVLARRLAKVTDSAAVRKVGYKIVKMTGRPMDEQSARGFAAQGSVWNVGTIEPYQHTAYTWADGQNVLAQFDKDVECAKLALLADQLAAARVA
jgi:hypothetical protein